MSFDTVKFKLNELNLVFMQRGLPFVLEFDYFKNFSKKIVHFNEITKKNDLFLVLFVNNICVSSIQCIIKSKFMYISSKTDKDHLGKKYNLLLRAIIVLLSPHLKYNNKKISNIRSFAINGYSLICLKKYFEITDVKNESCTYNLHVDQNIQIATTLFDKLADGYSKTINQ